MNNNSRRKQQNPFISAVVLCAGNSTRMGGNVNKQMIRIKNLHVFLWSVKAFEAHPAISEIVVVTKKEVAEETKRLLKASHLKKVRMVVAGGETRTESSEIGVMNTSDQSTHVLIHDGARPFVSKETIDTVIESTLQYGAAAPCIPITGTVKAMDENGFVVDTLDRATLREIQTPQGFSKHAYIEALIETPKGADLFDDCQMVERTGQPVHLVEGNFENVKLTTPKDLLIVRAMLEIEKFESAPVEATLDGEIAFMSHEKQREPEFSWMMDLFYDDETF